MTTKKRIIQILFSELKPGDIVVGYSGTEYTVTRVKPLNTSRVVVYWEGDTPTIHLSHVTANIRKRD